MPADMVLKLPWHVWYAIFNLLSLRDLCHLNTVSHSLKNLLKQYTVKHKHKTFYMAMWFNGCPSPRRGRLCPKLNPAQVEMCNLCDTRFTLSKNPKTYEAYWKGASEKERLRWDLRYCALLGTFHTYHSAQSMSDILQFLDTENLMIYMNTRPGNRECMRNVFCPAMINFSGHLPGVKNLLLQGLYLKYVEPHFPLFETVIKDQLENIAIVECQYLENLDPPETFVALTQSMLKPRWLFKLVNCDANPTPNAWTSQVFNLMLAPSFTNFPKRVHVHGITIEREALTDMIARFVAKSDSDLQHCSTTDDRDQNLMFDVTQCTVHSLDSNGAVNKEGPFTSSWLCEAARQLPSPPDFHKRPVYYEYAIFHTFTSMNCLTIFTQLQMLPINP